MNEKIGVIGLGYVGLPLALGFARSYPETVGFDLNERRVAALRAGQDANQEVSPEVLLNSGLTVTSDAADLRGCSMFIVGVPTPVDEFKKPDLGPLRGACEVVGGALRKGAVVVFESTVYPGVTEEFCGPLLAARSGLKQGVDFKLGYSPERINPGDSEHALEKVVKVIAGEDQQTLERLYAVYSSVIKAGVFKAASIKVAEAAKVIENTQRDLNIALMNELAIIFDRMNLRTRDVLDAAATKWNFLRFSPGLVGGHCIGVDPYYLTSKAEQLGYNPQVILAGRRINDGMGAFVAQRVVKLLANAGVAARGAKIGVLGVTFKENVSDLRNSRVPDIVRELSDFGIQVQLHDPRCDPEEALQEYGIELTAFDQLGPQLDGVILAVAHREFLDMPSQKLFAALRSGGIVADVKSVLSSERLPAGCVYWSL